MRMVCLRKAHVAQKTFGHMFRNTITLVADVNTRELGVVVRRISPYVRGRLVMCAPAPGSKMHFLHCILLFWILEQSKPTHFPLVGPGGSPVQLHPSLQVKEYNKIL
jgi:hypothetical protein